MNSGDFEKRMFILPKDILFFDDNGRIQVHLPKENILNIWSEVKYMLDDWLDKNIGIVEKK